jgi:hypothetical protein
MTTAFLVELTPKIILHMLAKGGDAVCSVVNTIIGRCSRWGLPDDGFGNLGIRIDAVAAQLRANRPET